MKPIIISFLLYFLLTIINGCAPSPGSGSSGSSEVDERIELAKSFINQRILTEANGYLTLESFEKKNGYDMNAPIGGNFYVIEWESILKVQQNFFKRPRWDHFEVGSYRITNQYEAYSQRTWDFNAGESITLIGKAYLRKTDNGWRVESIEVDKFNNHSTTQ